MARTMTLPKIGVNLEEITLVRWLVKIGDRVEKGDPILEAETDKATQEFFATESGIVTALLAGGGDTVLVGKGIAIFADDAEDADDADDTDDTEDAVDAVDSVEEDAAAESKTPESGSGAEESGKRIRISPLAKKLAKESGIDPARIPPGIAGRRITSEDVRSFMENAVSETEAEDTVSKDDIPREKLSGIRKTIATRLSRSSREKPTAALMTSVDATALLALRERYKLKGLPISIDAILVRTAAAALKSHPALNHAFEGEELIINNNINIGVATDTSMGLIVPVLKDADKKTLPQIGSELAALSQKAAEGGLGADDISGGSFTITNLGMFGVEEFVPIINPPECAILAAGTIKPQFCPDEDGNPELKRIMKLTLVFDHRIVDGAPAARFLRDLKEYLECPELMI